METLENWTRLEITESNTKMVITLTEKIKGAVKSLRKYMFVYSFFLSDNKNFL